MSEPNKEDIQKRYKIEIINSWLSERVQYFNYWNDHCVRYLLFVNAGGVIAVLTFMGILGIDKIRFEAVLALGFFTVGLILVGLLLDHMRSFFKKLWQELFADRDKLFTGQIADPQEVLDKDMPRVKESKYAVIVARISSVCILGGIVFGFISFFTKEGPMTIPIKEILIVISGASYLAGAILLALSIEFRHQKMTEDDSRLLKAAKGMGSPGKVNINKHRWGIILSTLGYVFLLASLVA